MTTSGVWILIGLVALPVNGATGVFSILGKLPYWAAMLACLAVVIGSMRDPRQRTGWALIVAGAGCWLVGDIYFTHLPPPRPLPSPADVGFGLFYPLLVLGILVLNSATAPPAGESSMRMRISRLVDGAAVGLASTAAAASFTVQPALQVLAGDARGVLLSLVYPALSSLVLCLLVVLVAVRGWVAGGMWWWLVAAVIGFWSSDAGFAVAVLHGRYTDGGLLDAGWLAGYACLGCAALWSTREVRREPTQHSRDRRQVVVPFTFAGVTLAVVVLVVRNLNLLAFAVAIGAMLAVLVRLALTLTENQALIRAARLEARTDVLTGLLNRRALLDDLDGYREAALDRPVVLGIYDLNGFKKFNDAFGHPAGDQLLTRLGQRLALAVGPGQAYRLGGDEYCVVVPADDAQNWREMLDACRHALRESGPGYHVSAAGGHALLPHEGTTAAAALELADQRMYRWKSRQRGVRPQRATDVTDDAVARLAP